MQLQQLQHTSPIHFKTAKVGVEKLKTKYIVFKPNGFRTQTLTPYPAVVTSAITFGNEQMKWADPFLAWGRSRIRSIPFIDCTHFLVFILSNMPIRNHMLCFCCSPRCHRLFTAHFAHTFSCWHIMMVFNWFVYTMLSSFEIVSTLAFCWNRTKTNALKPTSVTGEWEKTTSMWMKTCYSFINHTGIIILLSLVQSLKSLIYHSKKFRACLFAFTRFNSFFVFAFAIV